jgi:hypothetical protein
MTPICHGTFAAASAQRTLRAGCRMANRRVGPAAAMLCAERRAAPRRISAKALDRPPGDFCREAVIVRARFRFALVAQLDRASDFESEGREFESLRARHHLARFRQTKIVIWLTLGYQCLPRARWRALLKARVCSSSRCYTDGHCISLRRRKDYRNPYPWTPLTPCENPSPKEGDGIHLLHASLTLAFATTRRGCTHATHRDFIAWSRLPQAAILGEVDLCTGSSAATARGRVRVQRQVQLHIPGTTQPIVQ